MESFLQSTSSSLVPINCSIKSTSQFPNSDRESLLQVTTKNNNNRFLNQQRNFLLANQNHPKGPQIFAALAANLGGFALGTVVSWSSPALPSLRADPSFSITPDQESWIGSLVTLGACFGGPLAGILVECLGRRSCMLILTIPFLLGWLGIWVANNVYMVLTGRLITGICAGAFCLAAPIFVGEIADSTQRGYLSAGYAVFATVGILFIYTIGTYVSWRIQAAICCIFPILIFFLFLCIPESPRYLLSKGKREDALKALAWFRGQKKPTYATEYELLKLEIDQRALEGCGGGGGGTAAGGGRRRRRTNSFLSINYEPTGPEDSAFKQFFSWPIFKPVSVGLFLVSFNELSGIDVITFYTVDVFESAGVSVNSYYSTIIIGVVQLMAAIVAALISDRYGRRFLLLTGEAFVVISLSCLTFFFIMKYKYPALTMEYFQWLPLTSLIVFTFMNVVGLGTVGYMLMSEILPRSVKGFASSLIIILKWLIGFGVTKSFGSLMSIFDGDPSAVFGMFTICSCIGFVYIYFFVPETCGKTLEEIQALFENKRRRRADSIISHLSAGNPVATGENDLLIIDEEWHSHSQHVTTNYGSL